MIEEDLDEDLQSFQLDLQGKTEDLIGLGRWLVTQDDFIDLLKDRNSPALTKLLAPLTRSSIVDVLQVIDSSGQVVSQLTEEALGTKDVPVSSNPKAGRAAPGLESIALEEDATGQVTVRLLLPVYDDEQNAVIGTLFLGFYINGDFLHRSLRRTATDSAIVYKDRFAVNTLMDRQGNPLVGQLAPALVVNAERENRSTDLVTIDSELEQYFFKFRPFPLPLKSTQSMFGAAVPRSYLEVERLALLKTFGVGILASVVAVLVLGFLSARILVHPIERLTSETRRMARGDLLTGITLQRDDELGELAMQLDSVRQQTHQALQSSLLEKNRYAAIINALAIPIVMTDENHLIGILNPAAEAILKQSQASVAARPWHTLFSLSDKDEATMPPFWRSGEVGPDGEIGTMIRGHFPLRAQPQIVVDVLSTPVQMDGKTVGYVHSLKDATKIEEFDRVKDEFILNVAHELEGPLSSWRASLDLLVEDYASFNARDLGVMLRTLQRVAVKFQGLVERLIDMGKLQAGQFRVRPVSVALHRLVQDARSQIEPLIQTKGQQLELHLNCPTGCTVYADPTRTLQVIVNLLKNASKYGPEDQPILLSVYRQSGFVFFEVTDRGSGISAEEQGHLFQRFYRVKRAEEEGAGLGLGLALAKGIVEAQGGQIGVRSQVGEGATFWFSLPEPHSSIDDRTRQVN
jgi:two-component system sensor histidine kinase VicK